MTFVNTKNPYEPNSTMNLLLLLKLYEAVPLESWPIFPTIRNWLGFNEEL